MSPLKHSKAVCVAPVKAQLGEGPLWDPRVLKLLFVDIKGGKLFRFDPASGAVETFAAPLGLSALGLARAGGYVGAVRDGFVLIDIEGNDLNLTRIAEAESNLPGNRFNDGKVDPKGGFWAGTMDDDEKAVTGAWWRLAPDGTITRLDENFKVTNGPAFDPDRARVFLTDSARQTIYVCDTDGARLGRKNVFLQFEAGDGYPDGMEIDKEGCLWVAFWDGGEVRRFSPEGALLQRFEIPAPRPTSLAFAGERLYVTSARIGLDEDALKAAPTSGGLFEIKLDADYARAETFYFERRGSA